MRAQKARPSYKEYNTYSILKAHKSPRTNLERQMEVLYVDVLVGSSLALTPQQQTLLGGHLLNGNVLYGESKDDRPDHTQGHLQITINDLLGTNRHQMYTLRGNKVEGLVHVGDLVEAHLAAIGLGQRLSGDHLQQQHQLEAVAEVLLDVVDGGTGFAQMTVTPGGKCLLRIIKVEMVSITTYFN